MKGKMRRSLHLILPIVSKEVATVKDIMPQSLVLPIKRRWGGHHKNCILHTLNSKIKLLNNIQLL